MTGEMNTLRNKRIDLLKGMQGNKTNQCKSISHNDCVIMLLFLLSRAHKHSKFTDYK